MIFHFLNVLLIAAVAHFLIAAVGKKLLIAAVGKKLLIAAVGKCLHRYVNQWKMCLRYGLTYAALATGALWCNSSSSWSRKKPILGLC